MFTSSNNSLDVIERTCGGCRGRGVDRKGFTCMDCDGDGTVLV